jgi:mono/diheme cytochrome c family protein
MKKPLTKHTVSQGACMRRLGWIVSLLLLAAVVAVAQAPPAPAPSKPVPPADAGVHSVAGAYAYRTYCASCHGVDGRGDGPLAENLRFRPPDLTLVAKRNGGEFPTEKVQRIVDGRRPLPGHGGSDMPIWGDAFKNVETAFDEATVKEKVRSVVDYLRTLQAR